MQNAALADLGLGDEWAYEAIDVPPEELAARVAAMEADGFVGANVTVPHKEAALALADEASERAREIGATNTLSFSGGRISAENTDATGLLKALPRSPADQRVLVLGAGGAARAIVWVLAREGAEVAIANRTPERAEALARELGAAVVEPGALYGGDGRLPAAEFEVIINTTTVGMDGEGGPAELRLDPAAIGSGHTVVDIVYGAEETALIAAARERGATVLGELELAWRMIPNEFLAVTGTNGKTTTSELIGHIHREAGLPVAVVGNVGRATADLAGQVDAAATVVCEASSFQLEDTLEFAPEAAVLLNLTPDHLDRHATFDAYTRAKLEAFVRQGNDDVAVFPCDLQVEDLGGCARRVCFGTGPEAELADRAGQLWWAEEPLMATQDIRLRGEHNRANAMAAAASTLARGVAPDAVASGLSSFPGVAHRLEEVARRGNVLYVNDSKATNPASTVAGLRAFAGGVHLIAGGRSKGSDFAELADPVAERCRAVYLIGEATEALALALGDTGATLHRSGDLDQAVFAAQVAARPGEVVLLSPACASYDQYPDFEARGEHFRALALAVGDR